MKEFSNDKLLKKLINIYLFFLAFPCIYIFGNSITFYIFLIIIFRVGPFWNSKFNSDKYYKIFFAIVLISSLLIPYSEMPRHPGIISTLKILIQYLYWILLACFFSKYLSKIGLIRIGKYFLYGTVLSIIGFYLLPFNIDLSIINIDFQQTRNSFLFCILACYPFIYFYLNEKYNIVIRLLVLSVIFSASFFTLGRSGPIILLIQLLFIISISNKFISLTVSRFIIPLLIIFTLIGQSISTNQSSEYISDLIRPINPRLSNIISNERQQTLSFDKSWLIRKLMIDKGNAIFTKYPLLGIGPSGFKYYDSNLSTLRTYERLLSKSARYYNSRSSHNSYLEIIVSFGLLGSFVFLFIIGKPILVLIRAIFNNELSLKYISLISLVGILIHFYTITSITGALPWMVLGASSGAISQIRNK
tara:strand:- start:1271 stop:2521 length:1251 start_codon:yes stop_codon:yes gene_type:complete